MRRVLHMVLLVSVLLCGVHLAEPVQAHDEAAHHALEVGAGHADGEPVGAHEDGTAHAVQHHCPVAPDPAPGASAAIVGPSGPTHFVAPVAPLASLTGPPPLEPPAA